MKIWALVVPMTMAFWFTNGTSTLPKEPQSINFLSSDLDGNFHPQEIYVSQALIHTAPDSIHLISRGKLLDGERNSCSVSWPSVKIKAGSKVRLSFYYVHNDNHRTHLNVSLQQYPSSCETVKTEMNPSFIWKKIELIYNINPKSESVTPVFTVERKQGLNEEWCGCAWIDDVQIAILP